MFDDLFLVVNIGGVRAHAEELARACRSFAVVGLLETGFRDADSGRRTLARLFPDHRAVCLAPQDEDGIGCALLAHRHLRVRAFVERSAGRHRLQAVEVEVRGRVIRLASLYVPPSGSGGELDPAFLREGLERRCSVLAGDFNARSEALGCRTTNAHGDALADFLLGEGGVEATVLTDPSTPTFVHRSAAFADTLDWVLATPAASRFLRGSVEADLGSDHLPLAVRFSTPAPVTTRSSPARRWRTTKVTDWGPFRDAVDDALTEAGLVDLQPPSSPEDLDAVAERLEDAIADAADAALTRSRPVSDDARLPFPWLVVQLVRLRHRLRRLYAQRPSHELRQRLNVARRALQRELETHRRTCLEEKARFFAAGPSRQGLAFWQAIRRWFRGPRADTPALRRPDGSTALTPAERAETFAAHLAETFGGLSDPAFEEDFRASTEAQVAADLDLQPLQHLQPPDHLDAAPPPPEDDLDPAREVSAAEVWLQLRRLRSGKAPGLDGISPDILRNCPMTIVPVLAGLFTASLRLGHYPQRWRHSAMCLLPKAGKPLTSPGDFRPIALCSCVGKLLERLFAHRLQAESLRRRLLPPEQSAFLPGRDATEQLVLLAQRAGQAMNGGLVCTLVALDAHKAFDSVWHAGLLRCLRERQFSAPTRRWIAAFLRGRTAAVLEDGHLSRSFTLAAGVPQGSPLSPLLYILYTAEMPLPCGPRTGASVYADDVALWACGPSPAAALQRIRPALHRAVRWGRRWRIAFNPTKTQVGFFSRRSHWPLDALQPPHLMGVEQRWSETVDLLGLRLDRRLSLVAHTSRLRERLGPRALTLRRWTWAYRTVPNWVGALLFRSLLRPAYTYAAPVLLSAAPTAQRTLRRLERRGLRAALRRGLVCPDAELHARGRVGPLADHLRDLGGRYLLRLAELDARRVLCAFRTLARQDPGLARRDLPLERLYASLDASGRSAVRDALSRLGIFPGAEDRVHGGRNRRALAEDGTDPFLWGVSPFEGQ